MQINSVLPFQAIAGYKPIEDRPVPVRHDSVPSDMIFKNETWGQGSSTSGAKASWHRYISVTHAQGRTKRSSHTPLLYQRYSEAEELHLTCKKSKAFNFPFYYMFNNRTLSHEKKIKQQQNNIRNTTGKWCRGISLTCFPAHNRSDVRVKNWPLTESQMSTYSL